MTDYIRKAVELADGWIIHGLTGFSTPQSGDDAALDDIGNMTQMEKDALAAQLARQVDATSDAEIEVYRGVTSVWHSKLKNKRTDIRGQDRAMNTIKSVVDSKVLDSD